MFKFDPEKIRKDFPYLNRKINGKPIVYFDNAAMTQKPNQVLGAIDDYYKEHCANVHRGVHKLSQEASGLYEDAHKKIGKFVNAKFEETVFTRNTTESLNLIYYAYALRNLKKGDRILATSMEHHSNYVPLLELKKSRGIEVDSIGINEDGTLKMEEYGEKISKKTKIVTVVHVSNVLGTINKVKEIGKLAHENDSLFIVDAAQSVPHMPVDFKNINADFLCFSGYKMLGPTGIGVLIGKKEILEDMNPFLYGGDMLQEVHKDSWKPNKIPWKFEAGTPNIAGGIGLGAAVDYLKRIGMDKIRKHEVELVQYTLEKLKSVRGVKVYDSLSIENKGGIVSFNLEKLKCHETAGLLDSMSNVMCRSGMLCAQPLVESLNKDGVVRVSFYIYNTKEEIDVLIESLKKINL
ncbi:cysteine desulfurase [Candidatus Woesearchaeota archaeon]|nr:cysteine desulfurase [Candidatus Woesearchaeota archaeon]